MPNSPPAENPCTRREASSHRPAATGPTTAAVGATAIRPVPTIIVRMVIDSARLRPWRSAQLPMTAAPSGRMRYETAKVRKVSISAAKPETSGKNSSLMTTAKLE